MDIDTMLKIYSDYQEPVRVPIGISFTDTDAARWRSLNSRLEKIDKRLKLAMFARKRIRSLMDEMEAWVEEKEKRFQINSSHLPKSS